MIYKLGMLNEQNIFFAEFNFYFVKKISTFLILEFGKLRLAGQMQPEKQKSAVCKAL